MPFCSCAVLSVYSTSERRPFAEGRQRDLGLAVELLDEALQRVADELDVRSDAWLSSTVERNRDRIRRGSGLENFARGAVFAHGEVGGGEARDRFALVVDDADVDARGCALRSGRCGFCVCATGPSASVEHTEDRKWKEKRRDRNAS